MIKKYKKITIIILTVVPLFISLFLIDSWILPQKNIEDEIVSYSTITTRNRRGSSSTMLGHKFFTRKGNEFAVQETFIYENQITIKYSPVFKNITSVKTETEDYSNKIMSGVDGASLYILIAQILSAIVGLLMLKFKENLSENAFMNIILLNALLIFYAAYLLFLCN